MSMGYDFSCATLSQEGRIYQLEYAAKAVEGAPTVMGIVCSDGVILASEKIKGSKTIVSGSNPTIYSITPNIGMAVCGYLPDGRNLVTRAREEAKGYLKNYGVEISGKLLADRLSYYVQSHTMYGWALRPFGAVAMISSWDKDGKPHLFMVETSGDCFEYYSCCHGKGRQYVKTEVEKNDFALKKKTVNEALFDVVKILVKSYEGEKETEFDLSVISEDSRHLHRIEGYENAKEIVQRAKAEVEEDRKMQVD
jgi:20S proteasome subunit alpha 7